MNINDNLKRIVLYPMWGQIDDLVEMSVKNFVWSAVRPRLEDHVHAELLETNLKLIHEKHSPSRHQGFAS
jgi:hypothetical protein